MGRFEPAALPVSGSPDSSGDSSSTSEPSEDKGSDGNAYSQPKPMNRESLKLAVQFLSRPENKWSGPEDPRYNTDEYVQRFSRMMKLFGATSTLRILLLHLALAGHALEEYTNNVQNSKKYKKARQASALIRIVASKLETPELTTMKRNEWTNLTLDDMKK